MAGGTNAPSSGGTIQTVYARFYANTSGSTAEGRVSVSTDGWAEVLGTASLSVTTTDAWSSWATLTTPSGGWTWAKVQALEFRVWRDSGSGTLRIYMIQISVITDESTPDIGAVEARTRPDTESTTVHNETYSARLEGAGFHDDFAGVGANTQTTISIWTYWDSNYTGTKPTLKVTNIPGVADQTATATGSVSTWEQLTVTFTPSADAYVRVRYSSNDTSEIGKCYFADEIVTIG